MASTTNSINRLNRQQRIHLKKQIAQWTLPRLATGNQTFNVFSRNKVGCSFVIKTPLANVSTPRLKLQLKFAKDYMGGIIPPFTIAENAVVNGKKHQLVVVQKRLLVLRDESRLPATFRVRTGEMVDLRQKERALVEALVARGIYYPDALIPDNLGLDTVTGDLYLVDFGEASFEVREIAFKRIRDKDRDFYPRKVSAIWEFYKSMGDGSHFDRIGLRADDELYDLWGTKRQECRPTPDIILPL